MKNKIPILILVLCLLVGSARIFDTYDVFNETVDAPAHLAMGMEFLQYGTYTYEYLHPPLARVLIALGPYLDGRRLEVHRDVRREGDRMIYQDGSAVLYQDGQYERTLKLARLGTFPFFLLAVLVTFLWAKRWFGTSAAIWSAILFSSLPPVLGHAGLASLDMACAATSVLAMFTFLLWMERPNHPWAAAALGAAVGLAVLTKLSSIAYLGAGFSIAAAWLLWRERVRPPWKQTALAVAMLFVTLWAGYAFSIRTLDSVWGPRPRVEQILQEHPVLRPAWNAAMSVPLPLTELVLGVRDLARQNEVGLDSYILGEFRRTGWWYFFPLAIGVKTPVGFLLLALAGWGAVLWRYRRESWPVAITAAFAVAVLAVGMLSRIQVGVRHILVIYPLLAILAGALAARCFRTESRRGAWIVPAALVAWTLTISASWHPDYLAYFNLLAREHPERVLAESDLDWGQDLKRLAKRLEELNARSVSIRYFGSALLDKAGLPPYRELDPVRPSTGYIAISAHYLYLENAKNGSYEWLMRHAPVERIGQSIDLFYIPE